MAPAPPLVFEFVGVVFTAILYGKYSILSVQMTSERPVIGLYCLQFGLYCKWRIQLEREERWKGVLLYALTATFILCTVYVAIAIFQVQFFITVSHTSRIYYCSDVLASNMSGVQLIFKFPGKRAGDAWKYIGSHRLDHCK